MKIGGNAVTLYVGGNQVSKAYVGDTLVYGGGSPLPYISNGLVFYLDGINKGDDSSKWTDLIDGVAFTLNEHSSVETNAVVMDGVGGIVAPASSSVPYDFSNSTIEVCAERLSTENYGCVFYNKANTQIAFIFSGANKVTTSVRTASSLFTLDSNTGKNTFSCTPSKVVKNGVTFTTIGTEQWASRAYVSIGGRTNNGTTFDYLSHVRIHSIRIYNRILTDEEIANNQAIDNDRFNLGLNL